MLVEKEISQATLRKDLNIATGTMTKLRRNEKAALNFVHNQSVYITIGIRGRTPRNTKIKRISSIDGVKLKHIRFDHAYPFSFTKNIRENMIIGQSETQKIKNISFSDCYFELPGGFSEIPRLPETRASRSSSARSVIISL